MHLTESNFNAIFLASILPMSPPFQEIRSSQYNWAARLYEGKSHLDGIAVLEPQTNHEFVQDVRYVVCSETSVKRGRARPSVTRLHRDDQVKGG